jgi:hypothetical protein
MTDVDRFLSQFFGEGNDFSLPPTWRTDDRYARLAAFIDDLDAGPTRPVFLPRGHNGRRYVYAKAFGAAMGRRLGEALAAFVGPTYSHFVATPAVPRRRDQVETALSELGPGPMWRLEIPNDRWRAAWDALGLLRATWLERPMRSSDDVVPVGRLLRDFRIALISADEPLSAICLERLVASGAFDAANIAFLKVRRHDALGFPERALDGAEVDDLFRMRLPAAVREALLVAVHRRYLATAAAALDVDAACDVLGQRPELATVLAGPAKLDRVEAQAALLALALAYPPSADVAGLHAATRDAQGLWLMALRDRLPTPPSSTRTPSATDIRDLLEAGAYDAAWRTLTAMPEGVVRDRLAVHCALSLADPVRTGEVHTALMRHGDEYIRQVLTQGWQLDAWQRHLETIGLVGHDVPTDWFEFLDRVAAGEDLTPISNILDDIARDWSVPPASDRALAGKLARAPLEHPAIGVVLDALPLLLESLDDGRAGECSGVAISLILLSEEFNEATLVALALALKSFLASGPNASRYREVVGSLSDVASQLVQVRTIDRSLDLVDLLLAGPAVDEGIRLGACQNLLSRVRGLVRRLTPGQLVLAGELSAEAGLGLDWPSLAELSHEATSRRPAHGRTVLLYSLQERALDRVRRTLVQVVPEITVHTSSEHDGSNRLKDQVQASEVVLLATRRATHAATGFIERWATGQVVYVPGGGSASMLHAALEALHDPRD